MKALFAGLVAAATVWVSNAGATEPPVRVHAAGSLRAAFVDLGKRFEAATGVPIRFEFGPSGLLRDRIAAGEAAEVFASANMNHPESLASRGMAEKVRAFAGNRLCGLASPASGAQTGSLLERMLDPSLKLGISTPKADPSGDYAVELFRKADQVKPGSYQTLMAKALQLTGGPNSPPPPKDRSQYGMLVANGQADLFLTYCTNAVAAQKENPRLQVVPVPPELSVGARYGITLLKGSSEQARRFVTYLLSGEGQTVLESYGFARAEGA